MKTLLLLLIDLLGYMPLNSQPMATIPQGIIRGTYKKSYYGRIYSAFEGIPYAKPPVGELRFADPQPADKWNGILLANKSYFCISYLAFPVVRGVWASIGGSRLNDVAAIKKDGDMFDNEQGNMFQAAMTKDSTSAVADHTSNENKDKSILYQPVQKINDTENLDVVVHIHGGGFMTLSPKIAGGPAFIMDKDLIYVAMNYRLGIMGFLSTEDDVVPGNSGLKDQSLALKWIKDNIKYFGGNPNSITLTGLSSGAASVHYHYMSSWSRGLFHKGFSISGTALSHWALIKEPLSRAEVVARNLSCTTESTRSMVACLKKVKAYNLVRAILTLFVFVEGIPYVVFGPVVEKGSNPFLAEHPYKLLKEGKVYDVPWVNSNVKEEGLMPVGFFVVFGKIEEFDQRWNELMPHAIDINSTVDEDHKIEVVTKLREHYLNNEPLSQDNIYSFVQMFTDRRYLIDSEKAMRMHSKVVKSPVYYYFYSYILDMPSLYQGIRKGVGHSDDSTLLFKIIGTPFILAPGDEKMMNLLTDFMAVYAKSNVPTFNGIEWEPVNPNSEEINCMYIASPYNISMIQMKQVASASNVKFWNSLPIKENDKLFPEK